MNILILANEYFNLFNFRESLIKQLVIAKNLKKLFYLRNMILFKIK